MIIVLKNYESLERLNAILGVFNNSPLILKDEDEISVEELRKKGNCPVEKCLEKLRGTQKVFYKEKGDQWAFSLRKG